MNNAMQTSELVTGGAVAIWVHPGDLPYRNGADVRCVYMPNAETRWLSDAKWKERMTPMAAFELGPILVSEPREFAAHEFDHDQSGRLYGGVTRARIVVELLRAGYVRVGTGADR